MDLASVLGLLLAWGALIGSLMMEGGSVNSLVNVPAGLLVFGGTFGASMTGFRMHQIMEMPGILAQAFAEETEDVSDLIEQMVGFAERARREGTLFLEAEADRTTDPFLERALRLTADGTDPELTREILTAEVYFLQARHRMGESLFTTMGGFAPTLGIIGTVMGLIHMLANLTDPNKMGPLIAGAFIATLYGVSSANLIFLPIANKLRARTAEEVLLREIVVEGILAIQSGDNPRLVEEKLKTYVAPRLRQTLTGYPASVGVKAA